MLQVKHKYLKYKQKYLDLKKLLGGGLNYEYVTIWNEDHYGLDDFRPFNQRSNGFILDSDSDSDDVIDDSPDRQLSRAPTVENHIEECKLSILSFHTTIESAQYELSSRDNYYSEKLFFIGKIIYPENYTFDDLINEKRGYWLTVSSDNLPEESVHYARYGIINIKLHLNKADAEAEASMSYGTIKMHKDEIIDLHKNNKYDGNFHHY